MYPFGTCEARPDSSFECTGGFIMSVIIQWIRRSPSQGRSLSPCESFSTSLLPCMCLQTPCRARLQVSVPFLWGGRGVVFPGVPGFSVHLVEREFLGVFLSVGGLIGVVCFPCSGLRFWCVYEKRSGATSHHHQNHSGRRR